MNDDMENRIREILENRLANLLRGEDERDLTPYPDKNEGCWACKDHKKCPDAFMDHAVHCGAYGNIVSIEIEENES